jgi:lipopolysaccharide biosynthesis protein
MIIDADLVERLSGCLIRANSGFDFAAWAHAYSLLEIPQTCKRLYLVNDSLVGPLQPASYVSMIARIRGSTADLVGLTENSEPQPHLQSQFLVVTQRLLRSEVFGRLMRGIVNMPTKEGVIQQYETQITRFLRAHGFGCEAVFPRLGQGDDDTIHNWAQLIEQGFPFVRTRVLEAVRDTPEAARLLPERYLTARH